MRWPGGVPGSGMMNLSPSNDGGVLVAQVVGEQVDVAGFGEVPETGHVVWLPLRRVWQGQERLWLGGHGWPRGLGASVGMDSSTQSG